MVSKTRKSLTNTAFDFKANPNRTNTKTNSNKIKQKQQKRFISISANTFEIIDTQIGQNPYASNLYINTKKAKEQHTNIEMAFSQMDVYKIFPKKGTCLPDIVFVANGGLSLPRLRNPLVILPWMKYQQRREELSYLKDIFHKMNVKTIQFPGNHDAPFEGQAELKWFCGGTKAIAGYGYRSTLKTFQILDSMLKKIYEENGLSAPKLLVLPIKSFDYYHLDIGMLEYADNKCIVHKDAFSPASIRKIQNFLGPSNVHILETTDHFSLNSVVDGDNLIIHKLKNDDLKNNLELITGKKIIQVDTSEFEKSGGSVRCMVLDIFINKGNAEDTFVDY